MLTTFAEYCLTKSLRYFAESSIEQLTIRIVQKKDDLKKITKKYVNKRLVLKQEIRDLQKQLKLLVNKKRQPTSQLTFKDLLSLEDSYEKLVALVKKVKSYKGDQSKAIYIQALSEIERLTSIKDKLLKKRKYAIKRKYQEKDLEIQSSKKLVEFDLEDLNKRINHDKYIYMVLCDTRRVKNEREKKLLKYIAKISNEAHLALMKYMAVGLNERDTENFFLQYLRDKYYTRFMAYECICASGKNAATLHYILNNRDMENGDIFLISITSSV